MFEQIAEKPRFESARIMNMSVEKPRAVKVSSCNSSTVHRIPVKAKELRLSQGFKSKWPNHLFEEKQTRIEHLFLNLVSFLNFREPRYIVTSEMYRVTQRQLPTQNPLIFYVIQNCLKIYIENVDMGQTKIY